MTERDTIILKGRVGTEPTMFKQTENRGPYVRFRMVVPRSRRKDNGQWEELESRWYTIRMWGTLANNVAMSIRKGQPVVVVGRPTAQAWQDREGNLRSEIAINANVVGRDLNLGVSVFRKFANFNAETGVETFQSGDATETGKSPFLADDKLMSVEQNQQRGEQRNPKLEFDSSGLLAGSVISPAVDSGVDSANLADEPGGTAKFQQKVA